MNAHKAYVKNMLKHLQTGQFTRLDVITEMFTNSAEYQKDEEILELVKQSALYLVKEGILTADQIKSALAKSYPDLVKSKRVSPPINRKSPFGPFTNRRNPDSPIAVNMSRLGKDLIKMMDTDPVQFELKLREFQKEYDERQNVSHNNNNVQREKKSP